MGGCLCFDSSLFSVPAGGALLHESYIIYLSAEKKEGGDFLGISLSSRISASRYRPYPREVGSLNISQEISFFFFFSLSAIAVWHAVPLPELIFSESTSTSL